VVTFSATARPTSTPDRDTIPFDRALAVVEALIDHDERPTGVEWQIDRAPG
jgi:hypothetical protein